ncbi:MAG: type I-U CRISPR-associated protein Cas7 [Acidobacteria bacterium]|nr:MAG: type I-U CRISPR-associated protein Cas7 [Acidobacteriota bacterium]GIU81983.1 MAG: type I-U CRISPR-associated protein Cas7 [Pyrinomonadaceae bacterium]
MSNLLNKYDECNLLNKYDEWLNDNSDVAALVLRQRLIPVEGRGSVIFPPTYAKPERVKEEDWLGYNIDYFPDGTNVCLIDSVGSQANRIEPIFKKEPYKNLVPQIIIKVKDGREVNLLDAGHRAADAIVRFSELADKLKDAFEAWRDNGNAEPLAKIAPTSIVFGSWDSRDTQAKIPRVVSSVIRAFNVKVLHRSAQYIPPIDYVAEGLVDPPENKSAQDRLSELGLSHAPAPWTHGGVIVEGEIRRDATLSLVAIRTLGVGQDGDVLKLRRYIFGLALIALLMPQDFNLRAGCQLVLDPERSLEFDCVRLNGSRKGVGITLEEALNFATLAAEEFKVGENKDIKFEGKRAKEELSKSKKERKAAQRSRPETVARDTLNKEQEATTLPLETEAPKEGSGGSDNG